MPGLLQKYRDWILCVGILGVMGGCLSIFFLPVMRWRAHALQKPPQQLTVSELAQRGPGDNPHVVVTDIVCGSGYVFQIKTSKANNSPIQERRGTGQAWIPLFCKSELLQNVQLPASPDDEPLPDPTSFVVLLQTAPTLGNGTEFHLLSRRPQMTGLIIPYWLSKLTPELRDKLLTAYPDTNVDRCLILEEIGRNDKEETILFAQALLLGAIIGPLFGVPALAIAIKVGLQPKTSAPNPAGPSPTQQEVAP